MAQPPNGKAPLEIITACSTIVQGDVTFLLFGMTAQAFGAMASPRRFSLDQDGGVQRDLNEKHVLGFMKSMRDGRPIPTNVVVNLTGWELVDGHIMGFEGESFVESLDGQHRGEAADRLIKAGEADVVARYSVPVMAVMDASDEVRRMLFMSQVKALRVSREHGAALRLRSGDYPSQHHADAAEIAELLQNREDSPLYGHVHLGDVPRGPHSEPLLPGDTWITHSLLAQTMREALTGRNSITSGLTGDRRVQFAIDVLSVARECYPTQFDVGGTLRTPFGIRSLFLLVSRKDGGFRTRLQDAGCSRAEMVRLMRAVPHFHWAVRPGGAPTSAEVVDRFNARLNKALKPREV